MPECGVSEGCGYMMAQQQCGGAGLGAVHWLCAMDLPMDCLVMPDDPSPPVHQGHWVAVRPRSVFGPEG